MTGIPHPEAHRDAHPDAPPGAPSATPRPSHSPGDAEPRSPGDPEPRGRDRSVDAVRAAAVAVVVIWHTTLSLLQVDDGRLVMPGPVDAVPGGWLATWLLQVMPVFFAVGGFVHLTGRRSARTSREFLRRRVRRLGRPLAPFLVCWGLTEVVLRLAGQPPLAVLAPGVLAPLWFLLVYAAAATLTPVTAAWHERWGARVVVVGGLVLAALDAVRVAGVPVLGVATTALVWLLCHQLGYLWRDGVLDAPGRHLPLGGAAVAALALLTGPGPYPASMVASAQYESNMLPTTLPVLVVGTLQICVVLAVRPALARILRRPWCWRPVLAVNVVAMSTYLWHMPVVALLVWAWHTAIGPLPSVPDAAWWWTRSAWLVVVVILLLPVLRVVRRWDLAGEVRR
ncbi:MAG: acyltransferase family protein [Dermatophilaceae bacterium]